MRIKNPAFLNFQRNRPTADDFHPSIESENSSEMILKLLPQENYKQFIIFDSSVKNYLQSSINKISLVDDFDNEVEHLAHGYKVYNDYDCLYLTFKISGFYETRCLRIRIEFDIQNPQNKLYSNRFTCDYSNRDGSTYVVYRHQSDFYGQPFSDDKIKYYNQIRLPIWYLKPRTEQDSTESLTDTQTQSNIQISRVQRRLFDVYRVTAPNWMNVRIAILSDMDEIYFNNLRQSVRPFVFDDSFGGSELAISELESQELDAPPYEDDGSMIHDVIIINSIDEDCCTPSGVPIEPSITDNDIIANQCSGDGFRHRITIHGQPNSVGKLQLRVTAIQGQAKNLLRVGGGFTETYGFNAVGQILNVYYFLNQSGISIIELESCFEDCTPYAVRELQMELELFNHSMTTLNGQITFFGDSVTCVAPVPAQWVITNDYGTEYKEVQIINGTPNSFVKVLIECINLIGTPGGTIFFGSFFSSAANILQGFQTVVDVPTDGSGDSIVFNYAIMKPAYPVNGQSMIVVKSTILNSDGSLSNEFITLMDV